jgi:hypothetical protein|tara:strand:+ start:12659 stop:16525 length:3867 start_codon:yes stop_codon:yes gene_type:complete
MIELIDPEGFTSLRDEEINSERSAITSALAGVVSGAIKVPEGVISLGAELIDLGFDTDLAADVEQLFDKVNVFEDIANDTAIGRLTEGLVQIGVPGGIGFKLASKAIKAKKAGNYMNLRNTNLQKAAKKADDFNKTIGKRRFVAGVAGGAAGEAFVADVEELGTFGDVFEAGPTDLEEVTDEGGREDAFKKLMNRTKFGAESLLITPVVYGVGKGIKAAATRGKNIEFSNSKLDKFFNKTFSALRARGAKPQSIFEAKMAEKGATMADTNRAMELVKTIDSEVDSMFPTVKSVLDKSSDKRKADVYKQLNDILFEGELSKAIPSSAAARTHKFLKDNGATDESIENIFEAIGGAREKFVDLINASSNAPKDVQTLKTLMGQRVKDYLGSTYRIFEDKSMLPFLAYTPTEEAIKGTKEYFKRYAKENGKNLTDFQAQSMVDSVIKSAKNQKAPPGLPIKFAKGTLAEEGPQIDKFFKRVVTDDIKPERLLAETPGKDRAVIKKLFGEIEDPRFSIYNSMTKLSNIARKNELFERIAKQDDAIKKAATATTPGGSRGFFFDDALEAAEALPNQEIVELDRYMTPYFKDEFTINPLAGKFTTKAIAEGLGDSTKTLKFLFEPREGATGIEKGLTWGYRNLVLFPKAASQVAKTILSPQTHFRNLFSATAFSAGNGILFENPAVVGRAFRDAFGQLQVGKKSAEANEAYRELLELGVVNSQVQLGDIKNLLTDTRMGENLNIGKPLESMMKKLTSGTGRKLKSGMKFAEDLYTAEDDLFKIANYAVEMQRLRGAYTKVGKEFTERQLKEEAAGIVRNTVPNYAYVSDTVRALRRLPLGTFMSFPSEILRTTTNIAKRSIKEIKDPALRSIGLKRLAGMTTVLAAAPYGIQKGAQGLYNVTNEELRALKQFLPEWSKNSTIIPIRDEETGELKYIDFSHGNAYDTAIRPFQTLLNNIQQGITNEDVLMKGIMTGMAEAAGELASPFISEAIYTEAILDLIARGGKTREGRQIYTEAQMQNEPGTAIKNMIEHLGKSMLPFSYPQLTRLYQAAADKPSERGEFFELPDELTGFLGYRQVKIDPVRSMGFKISDYQRGNREARALFTGGSESLLKGGPKTGRDVIERFIVANKAKFNNDKKMRSNIQAADILGTDMDNIRTEFRERQLINLYNRLDNDIYTPFFPSENIQREFRQIEERIGVDNPFEEVRDVLLEIQDELRDLSFDDEFDINIDEYLPPVDDMSQAPLPPTPDVDPAMIQPVQQATVTQTGLTPSEQALLSPEEQAIRLRQRGMA